MKISSIIITKNEKDKIRECIDNLSFCDEIIVIDNESIDETSKIAESLGAKVFKFSSNSFSEARNFGLKQASCDWILYIDADEKPDETLKKEFKNAMDNNSADAFYIKRKNFYLGNNEWPYIEKMLRFFKKSNLIKWEGEIHETPKIEGNTGFLEGFLIHKTHKDLESMVKKTAAWSEVESALRLKANHPKMTWWRFPRVMFTAFFNY